MQADTAAPRPKRRQRRLIVLSVALIVSSLLVIETLWRESQRQKFVAEIVQAGGYSSSPPSLVSAIQKWWRTGRFGRHHVMVELWGPTFNNEWIRDHDYLRGLEIDFLRCDNITDEDLAHLIDVHPLTAIDIANNPLSDAVLRAIEKKETLTHFSYGTQRITDKQVVRFPLEGLVHLRFANTEVTPQGALVVRRCRRLDSISLDAAHLTEDFADVLASLGTVREIDISAWEASDADLERLHGISTLRLVHLSEHNSTTAADRAALAAALPQCRVQLPPVQVN